MRKRNQSAMAEWLELGPCNPRVPSSNPAQAMLQKSNLFPLTSTLLHLHPLTTWFVIGAGPRASMQGIMSQLEPKVPVPVWSRSYQQGT